MPGFIRVIGDMIHWQNQTGILLSLDIKQVIVVGEYTNSSGPWFDDWYLVFVTRDGMCFEISYHSKNIDDLTEFLYIKLDSTLATCRLANSAEWKSIVSYPKQLAGKSLFHIKPSSRSNEPRTFWEQVKFAFGLGNFTHFQDVCLSEDVKQFVAAASR